MTGVAEGGALVAVGARVAVGGASVGAVVGGTVGAVVAVGGTRVGAMVAVGGSGVGVGAAQPAIAKVTAQRSIRRKRIWRFIVGSFRTRCLTGLSLFYCEKSCKANICA